MCFHAISTQWEVIKGNLVNTPLQALHTVESPPKKCRLRPARRIAVRIPLNLQFRIEVDSHCLTITYQYNVVPASR